MTFGIDVPAGTQLLFEHVDIQAFAERCRDIDPTNISGIADYVKEAVGELLPGYDGDKTRSAARALELRAGHCYHRAAVGASITAQVPGLLSCVVVRHMHAYHAIASPHVNDAAIIDNDQEIVIGGDPIGIVNVRHINLDGNTQNLEFYAVAQTLKYADPEKTVVLNHLRRDENTNWRIVETPPPTAKPNQRILLGASMLRFIDRVAR